jgi:hypothetical protein
MGEKSVLSPIGNPFIKNEFEIFVSKSGKAVFAVGQE